ncbi:hypothetical protein ACN6KS_26990 [Paenibacillus nitricinens]|uniref:hypothetical protein n=1 Tax=Paenibacillus nitricinens TaxID=3367691 RepID=UPI003F870E34
MSKNLKTLQGLPMFTVSPTVTPLRSNWIAAGQMMEVRGRNGRRALAMQMAARFDAPTDHSLVFLEWKHYSYTLIIK